MFWVQAVWAAGFVTSSSAQVWKNVDPLIGTAGPNKTSAIAGGNAFPGASLPWSMVKPGIDTTYLDIPNGTAVDCNAGYSPLGKVTAVSMTHVSGTGGTPTYGLISQMPILGDLSNVNLADNTTYWQERKLDNEKASVGLFETTLENDLEIAITTAARAAYIKYTFPSVDLSPSTNATLKLAEGSTELPKTNDNHVLVDLTHVLPDYSGQPYAQRYLHGELHTRTGKDGQPSYFGTATYKGGWPQGSNHQLYFCGNFTSTNLKPTTSYVNITTAEYTTGAGIFNWPYAPLSKPEAPTPHSYNDAVAFPGGGLGLGAIFSWTPDSHNVSAERVVEAKVGVSYISAEQACTNIQQGLPPHISFEEVVSQARQAWQDEVLSSIELPDDGSPTNQNNTLKRMLYTALYQTALMPTDKTNENPHWQTSDAHPYYDDHYTLWDTYKTLLPLHHLLYTPTYSRIIKGLISIFTHEGFLPAGRSTNSNGRVQGGTHADNVLADAHVKNGDELDPTIDWQEAYRAVLNDARNLPTRNVDVVVPDGATKEGRGALDEYLPYHFITRNHSRSISRGLEYSQNDFAVYTIARGLSGVSRGDVEEFRARAGWWENQWNPGANTSLAVGEGGGNVTFSGFPGPRFADGTWDYGNYDPVDCGGCGWDSDIYEATVWETSFAAAPHDMRRVIELMGGDDKFIQRLDTSFVPGLGQNGNANPNNIAGSALFNPGNEPSFSTPFLYNYVPGHHWKTANQTRATVDAFYSDARNGYPGNTDGGAIPSWLVFNLIGLYPISAQPIYLLGAPRFSSLRLRLFPNTAKAKYLNISAPGISDTNRFPQSVTFNGQRLDRSWLWHEEVSRGGSLVFEMGNIPAHWDIGERPPTMSGWN